MINKIDLTALNTVTDKVLSYNPKKQPKKQAPKASPLPSSKKETEGAKHEGLSS